MKILVVNGPNINMLGVREPEVYGNTTYKDLVKLIKKHSKDVGVKVDVKQDNVEGKLVSIIQKAYRKYDGIVINPGAYTHTSIAILDALKSVNIPTVEVHISDVSTREHFRQKSYVGMYAEKTIMGKGIDGYIEAIDYLRNK